MNPIEEMMEKFGVESKVVASYTFECGYNKKEYEKDVVEYPPFTPEKQLEIFNFVAKRPDFTLFFDAEKRWVFIIDEYVGCDKDLIFAFAKLITTLYSDLTAAQKQQIKEILEG